MLSAAVAASLLCAGGVAFAQDAPIKSTRTTTTTTTVATSPGALSENAIRAAIAKAGYKEVRNLEFDDGVWEADARGGNDRWTELKVGPVTGKVYPEDAPSRLNADEIKAHLTTAGYRNIRDVKFDDGLWSVDATSSAGENVDLLVDPDDGSVVAVEKD
jgi:hypothetical protein